ncbi:hypothetical protein [Flavobacterium sp. XS2P14]|uniref:hypothetical protein n=1 Tax=Flavobacterium sp. XS2P14 TaxID=3401735 RepID=UPI003AAD3EEF
MKTKIVIFISILFISVNVFCQQIGDGFAPVITDFTIPLKSGAYNALNPVGTIPDNSYYGWQHLFIVRHPNEYNDHQLQLASSFTTNDRLFFRKIAGGLEPINPTWIELATRGVNSFVGDQSITGKLDVNGNINMAGIAGRRLFMGGVAGSTFGIAYDSNYPNYGIFYTEGEPDYVSISPNGNATAGIVNILGNGKVGIGTATPSEILEIYNSDTTPGTISLKSSRNDFGYVDVGRISAKQASIEVSRIGMPRAGGTNTGYLTFWTKSDNATDLTEKVRISEIGNVGIGTTTPDSKLTVNGNIHAKEVRIDLSIPAPDYVFASDYKLKSLKEVEAYIKDNSHLPEIPSAQEFEKNGLLLAEINMSLLKKIEEMTLYMIEQSKQMQILKKENEAFRSLSERLSKIENKVNN